jgi:hypothetical protein
MPRRTTAVPPPTSPRSIQPLSPWDHLILVGFQVKLNLQKGFEKWEVDFRDQLKNYLMSRPEEEREITAANLIKVSIVSKGGAASVDAAFVQETFKNGLRDNAFTLEQLVTLFQSGALGVVDVVAVRDMLIARGANANLFIRAGDPATIRHELRWQVLQPSANDGAAVLGDLVERVHQASGARLSDEDVALMLPQPTPVQPQQPEASQTVAVRASRRRPAA